MRVHDLVATVDFSDYRRRWWQLRAQPAKFYELVTRVTRWRFHTVRIGWWRYHWLQLWMRQADAGREKMTPLYVTNALLKYNPVVVASWWEVLGARLFGVKRVCADDGTVVTMHYWRGRYYVTGISP